ncbi:MAG: DUF4397 domain-containing protein [Burkholderiales bacterium]
MKNFRLWPLIGMVTAGVALSGCGSGGNDSGNANLRVLNATLTHPSIDLLVNSSVAASATTADNLSTYTSPASGSVVVQINDASLATSLVSNTYTLTGGNHFTVVAYESGGALKTFTIGEDLAAPASGAATLRIYDMAYEAGKLDVYLVGSAVECTTPNLAGLVATTSFAPTSTAVSSVQFQQAAGTYNVCVTASGSKTDLRMSASITLASAQVANFAMTPAAGGQLLNGSLLVQQSTNTATRNPNARVRLASAVAGGTVVNAVTGAGTSIDSSKSPTLGFYTLVPATSTLNITLNSGTSVSSPAATLTAGSDFTLLVYGDPAGPSATLITDDNRAPIDTTTTRVRLINGVNGGVGALTLTANNAPIGINVAPGSASTYASVQGAAGTATTAVTLTLSSASAGTLLSAPNTLNTGATVTMLAGDGNGTTTPQLLIR